jgi:hypothetical protein
MCKDQNTHTQKLRSTFFFSFSFLAILINANQRLECIQIKKKLNFLFSSYRYLYTSKPNSNNCIHSKTICACFGTSMRIFDISLKYTHYIVYGNEKLFKCSFNTHSTPIYLQSKKRSKTSNRFGWLFI